MKLFVKEVAQAKGYTNAKHLADAISEHLGVRVSYATIYPLWDDNAQLWSRSTFDRLCAFLQVPAGMLIQYIPGEFEQRRTPAGNKNIAPKTKAKKSG